MPHPEKTTGTERQENPEAQALKASIDKVVRLYTGEQLNSMLKTQSREERDDIWNQTAKETPKFKEKIIKLKQALNTAEETEKYYGIRINIISTAPFINIENEESKNLLRSILLARITRYPKHIDEKIQITDEANTMAEEMGLNEKNPIWESQEVKKISIEDIFKKVLEDKLRVTYQQPAAKK